jgi:hypothetical protein
MATATMAMAATLRTWFMVWDSEKVDQGSQAIDAPNHPGGAAMPQEV